MEINEGMKENKEAAHICNISCASMPLLGDVNFGLAQKPIIHVDRSADFNVMIYLLKGKMEVIEDGTGYELNPGSLLFLKKHVHHWGVKEFGIGTAWYYIHFYSDDITKGMQALEKQAIRKTNLVPDDYLHYISLPKMLNLPLGNELEKEIEKLIYSYQSAGEVNLVDRNLQLWKILLHCYELGQGKKEDVKYPWQAYKNTFPCMFLHTCKKVLWCTTCTSLTRLMDL